MITPPGDVRSANPQLWFCSSHKDWHQQELAIQDLREVLPEVPVLLSARFRDDSIKSRIAAISSTSSRFALEPNGEATDQDSAPTWMRKERPWLLPPPPVPSRYVEWITASLQHQASFDPALLITPSPTAAPSSGSTPVERLAEAAEVASNELAAQLPVLLGFSGPREWLRAEHSLQILGNVLVHTSLAGVFLRITHRDDVVRDRQYLEGLRDIVAGLAEAGLLVFLPYSGRLGWLSLAWGGWAISAGITMASWSDRERTPMNQPAQPSQWYYEHQLGIEVRWRHHDRLSRLRDYVWCNCVHCEQLQRGYDPTLARLHALEQLSRDVNELASANGVRLRSRRVRKRLEAMQAFAAIVSRRLGSGWEGYGLDYIDRWLEVV